MKCGQSMTPNAVEQGCQAEVLTPEQLRIRKLERDSDILHNDCIIEIAVRNKNVTEWMEHWEGRALKAESSLAESVAALKDYLGEYDNPVADYGLRVKYRNNLRAFLAKHSG